MDFAAARARMVREQLEARGIADPRVLAAMGEVPRELFVDPAHRLEAYDDGPLPITGGQTISQPYMVARMVELLALEGDEVVLEVGAGSGYQTAVLCALARQVYAVERIEELGRLARERLARIGCGNVEIGVFDGSGGWQEHAPYGGIVVAAGSPTVPPLLVDQLADDGRLVIPVGPRGLQRLAVVRRRRAGGFDIDWDTACTFVDLIGRYGWGGPGPGLA